MLRHVYILAGLGHTCESTWHKTVNFLIPVGAIIDVMLAMLAYIVHDVYT